MRSAVSRRCKSSKARASIWLTPARARRSPISTAGCAIPCASIRRPRCRFTSMWRGEVHWRITTMATRKSRLKPFGNTFGWGTKCLRPRSHSEIKVSEHRARCAAIRAQARSSKFQTPSSKESPSSKLKNRPARGLPRYLFFGLVIEIWNFFGAWDLVLGVSLSDPLVLALDHPARQPIQLSKHIKSCAFKAD